VLALWKLLKCGFPVTILSWTRDPERRAEVLKKAGELSCAHLISRVETTEIRTGEGGKVDLYKSWGIQAIFDDGYDYLQEALGEGMQIYPIRTRYENHSWWKDPEAKSFGGFAEAVEFFLRKNYWLPKEVIP